MRNIDLIYVESAHELEAIVHDQLIECDTTDWNLSSDQLMRSIVYDDRGCCRVREYCADTDSHVVLRQYTYEYARDMLRISLSLHC